MKRALLIARREYLAYARTVGFWLSLLALPFFAVLGGAVPILMERSEPVREVVLVEAPSEGASLSAGVQAALDLEALRRQAGALRAAAQNGEERQGQQRQPEPDRAGVGQIFAASDQQGAFHRPASSP